MPGPVRRRGMPQRGPSARHSPATAMRRLPVEHLPQAILVHGPGANLNAATRRPAAIILLSGSRLRPGRFGVFAIEFFNTMRL